MTIKQESKYSPITL